MHLSEHKKLSKTYHSKYFFFSDFKSQTLEVASLMLYCLSYWIGSVN